MSPVTFIRRVGRVKRLCHSRARLKLRLIAGRPRPIGSGTLPSNYGAGISNGHSTEDVNIAKVESVTLVALIAWFWDPELRGRRYRWVDLDLADRIHSRILAYLRGPEDRHLTVSRHYRSAYHAIH